jgi:threonine/homoserine/homoserine lactone efflux protein
MGWDAFVALFFFVLVAGLTPGPNNIIAMAIGFNHGYRKVLPHLAGVTVGFPVMLLLIGLVVRPVMEQYSVLFDLLKYASVAYILYIAWHVASAPVDARILPEERKPPITFVQSVMFQWINPKAWAGALTTVTVYMIPEHYRTSLLIAALLSAVTIVGAISLWALMGRQIKHFLDRPAQMRAFNVTMALLLLVSVGMMVGRK